MERKEYVITLLILASYGFFKEVRPSEPYLTEYLIDNTTEDALNLDKNEVYTEVYPIWPYSYFALLIPVFLLTDFLRYKPVIIFEALAYIGTWSLLLWARTLLSMQFMQFVYGVATSTEVAYYTYIYAKVPKEDYKKVSSYTRSAILFGRFGSGLLSQLLTTYEVLDYRGLNYVSFSSCCVALCFSIILPRADSSIYFYKRDESGEEAVVKSEETQIIEPKVKQRRPFYKVLRMLWADGVRAYSNSYVVKWSLWVVVSTCINYQVGNYIQALWEDILPSSQAPDSEDIWNGAVEAAATLFGAVTVFAVGFIPVNWVKWGDLAIVIVAGISSFLLYLMSQADEIWTAYICYVLYRMSYQVLMTVATVEIVKDLPRDSYGLIFGANLFAALGCQTLLTGVVNSALELEIKFQFEIYAAIFLVPTIGYAILAVLKIVLLSKRNSPVTY